MYLINILFNRSIQQCVDYTEICTHRIGTFHDFYKGHRGIKNLYLYRYYIVNIISIITESFSKPYEYSEYNNNHAYGFQVYKNIS